MELKTQRRGGGWPLSLTQQPTLYTHSHTHQAKAHALGQHLHARFQSELMAKHEVVGDVRGLGMMLGVELVTDRCVEGWCFAVSIFPPGFCSTCSQIVP